MNLSLPRRNFLTSTTFAGVVSIANGLFPHSSHADDAVSGAGELTIGSRRELFVDRFLIDHMSGAQLKLHSPQPQEVVLRFDQPWEGLYCGYETVIQDGNTIRMYYRGLPEARHALDTETTCVAESEDGIHFTKPNLGLFEVRGTSDNNCVLARHRGCHNLAPFIDTNPDAPADQRYKALGGTGAPGLIAFTSPDGIHWNELQSEPVITEGAFDSQNNAFWSEVEQQYVCFFRVFREGTRWIARTTSEDFVHWTPPIDLEVGEQPREHLYTNQMEPYSRAPHICIGMPTRFMAGRRGVSDAEASEIGTPPQYLDDCTDILLTSSRGGDDFERTFMEAFIRPGPDLRNWTSRANYAARGIVQTSDTELSLYVKHNSGYPTNHMRRYTLRPDGFISVNAPYSGGELVTKPFKFAGSRLFLNYATSAAGGIQVELQGWDGDPIEGFRFDDCPEFFGDRIDHAVTWFSGSDVSSLAGRTVRLRIVMHDADVYALRFGD